MERKIRVAAVNYLNTKPLIYGFEQGSMKEEIELITDYPSNVADMLLTGKVDVALVPVATMPKLKEYYVVSDYCIGCNGAVASVCLFSDVPLNEIDAILLDYQSRSSVGLLKILLAQHWKVSPKLVAAQENYEQNIKSKTAGLVIGDRAFELITKYKYVYDLGTAWKDFTGLPFVFAAWISNIKLENDFVEKFNAANEIGLKQLQQIANSNKILSYDLYTYYTNNISYNLNENKLKAVKQYLQLLNNVLL